MSSEPLAGILVTRRFPSYKDVPGERYHYPKRLYQRSIESLVGALVLMYEPRRGGRTADGGSGGRSAFVGLAYIDSLCDDPEDPSHGYANLRFALDFNHPVPVGSTNVPGKALQTAILAIPYAEACRIIAAGLVIDVGTADAVGRQGLADVDPLTQLGDRPVEEILSTRIVRDASFRYQVVNAYRGACAFTGIRLTNGLGRAEVDAAHIRAVADNGPDTVRNGIALMRTMHWAFDRGLVALTDDGRILTVDRGLDDAFVSLLRRDRQALFPAAPDLRPHHAFVRWHRENRFKGAA